MAAGIRHTELKTELELEIESMTELRCRSAVLGINHIQRLDDSERVYDRGVGKPISDKKRHMNAKYRRERDVIGVEPVEPPNIVRCTCSQPAGAEVPQPECPKYL